MLPSVNMYGVKILDVKLAGAVAVSRTLIAAALICGGVADARAASLQATAFITRFNCAAAGDPNCAGGQVSNDPAFSTDFSNLPSGVAGAQVAAGKSYFDPRPGTTNSASVQAIAGFGVLKVSAAAAVSSSPPLGSSSPDLLRLAGVSVASFSDMVTIHPLNGLLIGTGGTYTGSFVINGSLDGSVVNIVPGSGGADANWRVAIHSGSFGFGGGFSDPNFFGSESYNSGAPTYVSGLGDVGTVTFTAPFIFGTPFQFGAAFTVVASGTIKSSNVQPLTNGITAASASALYGNTVTWGGIGGVRAGSNVITDFSVASESGVNYALAVPEPSTLWLLAGGLMAVGRVAKRRTRRSAARSVSNAAA